MITWYGYFLSISDHLLVTEDMISGRQVLPRLAEG